MKHTNRFFIAIIFASTLIAVMFVVVLLFSAREKMREGVPADGGLEQENGAEVETQPSITGTGEEKTFKDIEQSALSDAGRAAGVQYIFFVADGDLWRAKPDGSQQIKLIDRDTVRDVEISSDGKHIGYTVEALRDEDVTDWTGKKEMRSLEHHQLLLADEMGSNSVLVQEFAGDWGWVPESNLLWYETASLKEIFDWGYHGNGDIWMYDIDTRKRSQLVGPSELPGASYGLLSSVWSPDGSKVLYINGRYTVLSIADRVSGKQKDLMKIPWVGGDRGGPPPLPQFSWSQDSQYIYTAFTPVVSQDQKDDKDFDRFIDGHLNVFRISADGSGVLLLLDGGPAPVTNDEVYPGVVFYKDRLKLIFQRYSEDEVKGLNMYDWLYPRNNDDTATAPIASLVFYDLEKGIETVLEKDFGNSHQYYYNLGFYRGEQAMSIDKNSLFLFFGDRDQDKVFLRQYDTESDRVVSEFTIPSPEDTKQASGNVIRNILFSHEDGKIYFQRGSFLYLIDVMSNKQEAEILIRDVENVAYR